MHEIVFDRGVFITIATQLKQKSLPVVWCGGLNEKYIPKGQAFELCVPSWSWCFRGFRCHEFAVESKSLELFNFWFVLSALRCFVSCTQFN